MSISKRQEEHERMIDGLDINGVLDRYYGKADSFVLISSFDSTKGDYSPYDHKYRYGRYKLEVSDAKYAFDMVEKREKKYLRRVYDKTLSDEQKAELPSFDAIYEDIKAECIEFNERRKRGELRWTETMCKEYKQEMYFVGDNLSIYNLYEQGKVKYCMQNDFIKYCYLEIGGNFANDDNCYEILKSFAENDCDRPLEYKLYKPPFNELLPHLISITPTFIWHCTWSGGLAKEFRFRFNETTKAWLAEHYIFSLDREFYYNDLAEKNDCFKYGLEDLAFYDGDKLLFSQCTHERFQNDYLERF